MNDEKPVVETDDDKLVMVKNENSGGILNILANIETVCLLATQGQLVGDQRNHAVITP
jgi:hypothetical protein